jgi:BTB/POZ domain
MDLPEMLQCGAAQAVAVDPIYISQDNFYDHLAASLQRWQSFGDLIFVLSNYEVVPTNHFLLSTLSAVVQALPKGHNMESYFLLKDIDPWSAKCMINFFYAQEMVIPRYSLENLNRVLDTLEVNIGGKFVDGAETVHFAMSHLYKRDTLEKIWQARHASFDLKIITKDRREMHAHWAVLAASSEQLYALFQVKIKLIFFKMGCFNFHIFRAQFQRGPD